MALGQAISYEAASIMSLKGEMSIFITAGSNHARIISPIIIMMTCPCRQSAKMNQACGEIARKHYDARQKRRREANAVPLACVYCDEGARNRLSLLREHENLMLKFIEG